MSTSATNETDKQGRGRTRSFDREQALDAAVLVFWDKGYEGASIEKLTHAMGINRPSLYGTFGNKRDLFLQAIDRYAATHGSTAFSAFRLEPHTRTAVERFFEASIDCAMTDGKPRGCLINTVATDAAETDPDLRDKLTRMFGRTDAAIARRLAGMEGGTESTTHSPDALARMVHSVTHSIMTRARAGASRDELAKLANDFMAVLFPEPHGDTHGIN